MRERSYRFQLHFNAMHNIEPEKPDKMHAHTFRVIVCLRGESDDFAVYNECEDEIRSYLKRFQGTRLNHMPQFKNRIPNLETICEVLYKGIDEILEQKQITLVKVELGDNPLSTYSVGRELLVGSIYRRVSEEEYSAYLKEIEGK